MTVVSQCAIVVRMATSADQFLTSTQVGGLLGKSARTVSRLALKGELKPSGRMAAGNGVYLFTREEVDRYIAEQAEKAEAAS